MKSILGSWAVIALTWLAGCVPSLNPVYEEDQLVFDANLQGVWKHAGSQDRWELTR